MCDRGYPEPGRHYPPRTRLSHTSHRFLPAQRGKNTTDTNTRLVDSNRSAALSTSFTTHSKRMCLKSNSTQSVNTCKSSRSHHLGDFHTVKTRLPLPACLLTHSSVSAEALLLKGNSAGSDFLAVAPENR